MGPNAIGPNAKPWHRQYRHPGFEIKQGEGGRTSTNKATPKVATTWLTWNLFFTMPMLTEKMELAKVTVKTKMPTVRVMIHLLRAVQLLGLSGSSGPLNSTKNSSTTGGESASLAVPFSVSGTLFLGVVKSSMLFCGLSGFKVGSPELCVDGASRLACSAAMMFAIVLGCVQGGEPGSREKRGTTILMQVQAQAHVEGGSNQLVLYPGGVDLDTLGMAPSLLPDNEKHQPKSESPR